MSIVVNTNVPSMKVQRNLNEATNALNEAVERMTTGLKINKAADDSAGLYIASGLDNQIRGSEIAEGNVETGINLLQIAEGDLTLIQEHVSRIRDLATEAASDYYTADARSAMSAEANARLAEINRLAAASNFNGKKLLDGTSFQNGLRLQIGAGTNDSITITGLFAAADGNSIGLAADAAAITTAFSTATAAAAFLTNCDTAMSNVTSRRSAIGATQSRLNSAYDSLLIQVENVTAAKSTIMDADIAKESSNYTQKQILQQASASLLVQANQAPAIALNLI